MSYAHLYQPLPCANWPEDLLQTVGATYREARGNGLDPLACLDRGEAAYIAAGGLTLDARDARDMVVAIIASLSAERGDWLWGPAQEWVDRHATA